MPGARFIQPMAALPVTTLPEGDGWLYEAKFDGYRALVVKNGPRVKIVSRNGNDLTAGYPSVRQAAEKLRAESALVDGEIVAELTSVPPIRWRKIFQSKPAWDAT